MNPPKAFAAIRLALAMSVLLTACAVNTLASSTEKILHNFGAAGDGANPSAGMTFDAQGNLYGTTAGGGTGDCVPGPCGIIFQLTPNQNGTWTENLVHTFQGLDGGFDPNPVILDRRGNLYGASPCAHQDCFVFPNVGGVVFQITPGPNGSWDFRLIQIFSNVSQQGYYPSGLAFDPAGHLYGTTSGGGPAADGVAFLLGQVSVSGWYEIVAHYFTGGSGDGSGPTGALAFDNSGNVYGVTTDGGAHNNGTVYKLTPNHDSFGWSETVLYEFTGGNDGKFPNGVVLDAAGNLYGTTEEGGAGGLGTVFELTPNQNGTWTENVLHSFAGGSDGAAPQYAPTLDAVGDLYGTALRGGSGSAGIVYELTPSGGQWQENIVYSFTGGADGGSPYCGVVLDNSGNVYGTTYSGGAYNNGGVAFEITP
jgi:uncharacterized repeat protein (TIGR03803 family)